MDIGERRAIVLELLSELCRPEDRVLFESLRHIEIGTTKQVGVVVDWCNESIEVTPITDYWLGVHLWKALGNRGLSVDRNVLTKKDYALWIRAKRAKYPEKPMPAQSETSRAENEPVDSNAILRRIDEMHSDLGEKLDDVKRIEVTIYERIGSEAQSIVNSILRELREQAISQGEMQRMLDAIRRALKYALQKGLPVDDPAIKQSLAEIYQAVNSDTGIRQQLELSVPIVPFLLEYKVALDAGVDLGAVWKEWTERVQKNKKN